MTPFFDLRVSQVVAAASVLVGIVLMIVFRKRTSLSGCGSKKIMELNGIADEIPEEEIIDTGNSTIFGDLDVEMDESDALAEEQSNDISKESTQPDSQESVQQPTNGEEIDSSADNDAPAAETSDSDSEDD